MIWILALVVLGVLAYEEYARLAQGVVAGYARNAGFSGTDLGIAVAIAYAESGGNPNAVGDVSIGRSIGLWQIYLPAHPEYTEQELYDPQTNANAAFAIYQQSGDTFSAWSTFRQGPNGEPPLYLKFLS